MLIPDVFKLKLLYLLNSLFLDNIILFVDKLLIGCEQEVTFILKLSVHFTHFKIKYIKRFG